MNIKDQILNACNAAINEDFEHEGVDLDEAGTQVLVIKGLAESSDMDTLMSSAQSRLEQMILDDYHGENFGDEPHRLGAVLGFSKEQIDEALNEGYLPSTDPLDEDADTSV